MKITYRVFITILCLLLWFLLDLSAAEISQCAREAPYREKFPFPCFLQQTDVYAWSLSSGEDGAELLIQNIGDDILNELEIVFVSHEINLVFRCEELRPGERRHIQEVAGLACADTQHVICSLVKFDK